MELPARDNVDAFAYGGIKPTEEQRAIIREQLVAIRDEIRIHSDILGHAIDAMDLQAPEELLTDVLLYRERSEARLMQLDTVLGRPF